MTCRCEECAHHHRRPVNDHGGAALAAAGEISGTVSNITTSTGTTADSANTTRQSAEQVSAATGDIETLIGQFRY